MTRNDYELEYLELCDALEREATDAEFNRYFKDPQFRQQLHNEAKNLPIVCTDAGLMQSAAHFSQ